MLAGLASRDAALREPKLLYLATGHGRSWPHCVGLGPQAGCICHIPPSRLAEPDLEIRALCTRRRLPASSTPQLERAWDAWQAERYQRGEISQRPGYTDNPFLPR